MTIGSNGKDGDTIVYIDQVIPHTCNFSLIALPTNGYRDIYNNHIA